MSDDQTVAVLDVGSNTVRLLVGVVNGHTVRKDLDESDFVRLGQDVDKTGCLDAARMDAAIESIARLTQRARDHGAHRINAIATSAVRDAGNGQEFALRVQREIGIELEIISGDREAALTFAGSTIGLDMTKGVVVVDLGGGSAELIAADASGMRWACSLQLGSGRLTERHVRHDPPQRYELDAVRNQVEDQLAGLPPFQARLSIFTGGTATHLGILAGAQDAVANMTTASVRQVMDVLASQTSAWVVEVYRVRPERAKVLPAGIRALLTIAEHYRVDEVTITRAGLREGRLLETAL